MKGSKEELETKKKGRLQRNVVKHTCSEMSLFSQFSSQTDECKISQTEDRRITSSSFELFLFHSSGDGQTAKKHADRQTDEKRRTDIE